MNDNSRMAEYNPKTEWDEMDEPAANRNMKDTVFRHLFSEKKELLELYNAVNGSHYADPDELEITTLDNVIYMTMKNDLSFLISHEIHLYEHQSTLNPNMPLRGLFYMAVLYRKYVRSRQLDIYGSVRLSLPVPRFIVFYNGEEEIGERMELRLSDSFPREIRERMGKDGWSLECRALVLNINYGYNREIMEACRTLEDYAIFIAKIREYRHVGCSHTAAVERAIDYCVDQNVLREFLMENREEVRQMILEEYDPEFHMRKEKELSYQAGWEEGQEKGRKEGLTEGRIKGLDEGDARAFALMQRLVASGRIEDLMKAAENPDYKRKLMEEFSL